MQIAEVHRQAAREEHEAQQASTRMSEKNAARLRAINESERADREANKIFAAKFHNELPKDMLTLVEVLKRICTDHTDLMKRALKLRRCLAMGWKVSSPHDVLFFSTLTPDEVAMSEERFYTAMTTDWPTAPQKTVEMAKECKAGSKCIKLYRRKPAPASPGSLYCSKTCANTQRAVLARSNRSQMVN